MMRNTLASFAIAAATLIGAPMPAASDYPERAIEIVVPTGAGDALDTAARVIAGSICSSAATQ